jgi:hypothetical protein
MREVNWLPAIMSVDRPTLALLPESTVSAYGIWAAVRLNRAGMVLRPEPALNAVSSARPTERWWSPRPDNRASDACRFKVTLVAL